MHPWFVYLLRCSDDSFYCGITTDMDRRLKQHNDGKASKYTRSRLPVELETYCQVKDKSEALKLELAIKRLRRHDKIARIDSYEMQTDKS